jgi:hypothetical protein
MHKLLGAVLVLGALAGCATPAQNAALAGAVVGGAVAASVYAPRYAPPPQRMCYSTSYYDGYGRLIRRTTCH